MPAADRLSAIATSRAAVVVAGVWGFAEATLFFIVPDVWLGFVALFAPRRAAIALLATVTGALLGALVLALVAPRWPELLPAVFIRLPAISSRDLELVAAAVAQDGPLAFLASLVTGQPIKLVVHAAAVAELPLPGVLAMVVVNRLVRVGLVTAFLALVGLRFDGLIRRHALACLAIYAAVVVAFYAVFWSLR